MRSPASAVFFVVFVPYRSAPFFFDSLGEASAQSFSDLHAPTVGQVLELCQLLRGEPQRHPVTSSLGRRQGRPARAFAFPLRVRLHGFHGHPLYLSDTNQQELDAERASGDFLASPDFLAISAA